MESNSRVSALGRAMPKCRDGCVPSQSLGLEEDSDRRGVAYGEKKVHGMLWGPKAGPLRTNVKI